MKPLLLLLFLTSSIRAFDKEVFLSSIGPIEGTESDKMSVLPKQAPVALDTQFQNALNDIREDPSSIIPDLEQIVKDLESSSDKKTR